jgi:hypothetical protein
VTDIDGVIKNAARLDISTDKSDTNGSESRFLKVREIGALQLNVIIFLASYELLINFDF